MATYKSKFSGQQIDDGLDLAYNSVQKTGDTMTGNLAIEGLLDVKGGGTHNTEVIPWADGVHWRTFTEDGSASTDFITRGDGSISTDIPTFNTPYISAEKIRSSNYGLPFESPQYIDMHYSGSTRDFDNRLNVASDGHINSVNAVNSRQYNMTPINLPATCDLNDYRIGGIYVHGSGTAVTNCPNGMSSAFCLIVEPTGAWSNGIIQTIYYLNGGAVFRRLYNITADGTWGTWNSDVQEINYRNGSPEYVIGNLNNPNCPYSYETVVSDQNAPTLGLPARWWHLKYFHHHDNNGYGAQLAISLQGSVGNVMMFRCSEGTTWNAWSQVYPSGGGEIIGRIDGTGSTSPSLSIPITNATLLKYRKIILRYVSNSATTGSPYYQGFQFNVSGNYVKYERAVCRTPLGSSETTSYVYNDKTKSSTYLTVYTRYRTSGYSGKRGMHIAEIYPLNNNGQIFIPYRGFGLIDTEPTNVDGEIFYSSGDALSSISVATYYTTMYVGDYFEIVGYE